jgi:hypothetical protein
MEEACIYFAGGGTASIASHFLKIVDETTRGVLAQAMRTPFTTSGIDHSQWEVIDDDIGKEGYTSNAV